MTNIPEPAERQHYIFNQIQKAFAPEFLEVLDESHQHVGHAGHQGGGRHFAVKIQSARLNALSRVEAHRQIYALFSDLMPHAIHALRIELLGR